MATPLTTYGAHCVSWVAPNLTLTIGGTPLASGTAPPAVTWATNLARTDTPVIICDGTGTVLTATFKWSLDGGTTFQGTLLSAAAVVTAMTTAVAPVPTFPVGSYTTGNRWDPTVATWPDQAASPGDFTNATASQQPKLAWNTTLGVRQLVWSHAAGTRLTSTKGLSAVVATTPCFISMVVSYNSLNTTARPYVAQITGDAAGPRIFQVGTSNGNPRQAGVGASNTTLNAPAADVVFLIRAKWNSSTGDYIAERSEIVTGTSAGAITPAAAGFVLGDVTTGNALDGSIYEYWRCDVSPTQAQLDADIAYVAAKYGSAVVGTITTKTLSATITGTPTYSKSVGRAFSATLMAALSLVRSLGIIKALTLTGTASYVCALARKLSATIAAASSCVRSIARAWSLTVAGTPTYSSSRTFARTFSLMLTGTPSYSRGLSRSFSGSISGTPTYVRSLSRGFAALLTAAPSYARQVARNLSATIAATPTHSKSVGRLFGASFTTGLSLVRALGIVRALTLTGTPTYVRSLSRGFAALLTAAPSYARQVARNLSASIAATPTCSRQVNRRFASTLVGTPTYLRAVPRDFAVMLTASSSIKRTVLRTVGATVSFVVTFRLTIVRFAIATFGRLSRAFDTTGTKRTTKVFDTTSTARTRKPPNG